MPVKRFINWKIGTCAVVGLVGLAALLAGIAACDSAPNAFIISGPRVSGNEIPTLTFLEPIANITRDQAPGTRFLIRWTDTDGDSNAQISFSLVNVITSEAFLLVAGIEENDLSGPDSHAPETSLIPVGVYNLLGTIVDDKNPPVIVYATTLGEAVPQRVAITIVEPGQGPPTFPPIIFVVEPAFNLSVAQDDVLNVVVQPSELAPDPNILFDPDSNVTLYVLLDMDVDPYNDDPANPDANKIIVLQTVQLPIGTFDAQPFELPIDLAEIPPRSDGRPYYIRATADDATNPRVHQYAVGTISVVELAAGTVDLSEIGEKKAGVRFYGFNPGANAGSSMSHVGDFDADGIADFVVVAQFGNPRNVGLVGEAYLIYGQLDLRFGGALPLNTISETISGVIFEAPPARFFPGIFNPIPGTPQTGGISAVSFVRDLSGDGRPDLLFGIPLVHGAFEAMDFDPGDQDIDPEDNTIDVEVVIQQGNVTWDIGGDESSSTLYFGVDDLTISSEEPNTSFGSLSEMSWLDDGAAVREFLLIKFSDVRGQIPDALGGIDITTIEASLELRVFDTGFGGTLHQALTDFNEQTTYATFAVGGGAPEPTVDYEGEEGDGLDNIDGADAGIIAVDVSDLVRQLMDGVLAPDNELRFIIIPDGPADDPPDRTGVRSTEFGIARDRPTLRISYTRLGSGGSMGCYPDPWVNNFTSVDPDPDVQFYAGGMAVVVNSQNRDSDPGIVGAVRLESTVVSLELAGQESGWILDSDGPNRAGGMILARASNTTAGDAIGFDTEEAGRISGARFTAGWFDDVDHLRLNQPSRAGRFGQDVASIGDLNNDGFDEIIVSAPRNERYLVDLFATYGFLSTHWASTGFFGSITVLPGNHYNDSFWRELGDEGNSTTSIPVLDQQHFDPFGRCGQNPVWRNPPIVPVDSFEVFAEDIDDMLGGAQSAGDFNQDGLDDILCGAPLNDRSGMTDSGAAYVLYGRNVLGNFNLRNADDQLLRTPMLRIRGVHDGDQIGWQQTTGLDVNGDRIDDVFISSPRTDFGGVARSTCAVDYDQNGVIDEDDLDLTLFNDCRAEVGDEVFTDDLCKIFDYDNDGDIDEDDAEVFDCLADGGTTCCEDLVDNGFVGIIFGGVFIDGDRNITQITTSDLPGAVFYGAASGHRAGVDVSSAGDFNQDGFGDILITVPGESRVDSAGRVRQGVVYLIFGGTHLYNTSWSLAQVGTEDLPGAVFLSPYVAGRPNEAAPTTVAFLGDINGDGFGDIAIGNPKADFIDLTFPQGPDAPDLDAAVGRRRNAGDVYVIYGNNFGSNRSSP